MLKWMKVFASVFGILLVAVTMWGQSTTATIQGLIMDQQQALIPGVTVTVRNLETNVSRSTISNDDGRYRIPSLPVGTYEVTAELSGFTKYVQSGVTLALNQTASVDVTLKPAGVSETVNVVEQNAPPINTSNAEVGVLFDTKRIAELPLATDRNVYNVALSAPGVSQIGSGQTEFSNGTNFSSNGMRLRSNNIMIDGQDNNDPSVTGRSVAINNPDIVQEIRVLTNQFAAEYGRAAGSILNVITKSGTNNIHGSAFWFHNDNALNSRNNLDENAKKPSAPWRIENQFGGTAGGPIVKDHTFFFGSFQRWTDRRVSSGNTINGVPTDAGRQILQQAAGSRPQVAALLKFLPPAQTPLAGKQATFNVGGTNYVVPLGALTGSAGRKINDNQYSGRIDHQFSDRQSLSARYLFTKDQDAGRDQVTPPHLTTVQKVQQQAANVWLTSTLSSRMVNEVRAAFMRYSSNSNAEDDSSKEIPSLEISELGLTGFNAASSRTAIGLAINLPQFRTNNTYQVQDNLAFTTGNHAFKVGTDIRKVEVKSFFVTNTRGRLAYSSLQRFVDDVADSGAINRPVPGGQDILYYYWWDLYFYGQDEWKVSRSFTLNYGLRYELPGNSVKSLVGVNDRIVATAGGDERFRFTPVPQRDTNNFEPRVGFNWNPHTATGSRMGWLTGGDKFVLRGGYSRTHDYGFININLNIASAFPFLGAITLQTTPQPSGAVGISNAFATGLPSSQLVGDPLMFTRTTVASNMRAPIADQFSMEIQRELTSNLVLRVGYVGTKGAGLFQTLDGNPRLPFSTQRVDPTRGVIRLRANAASSIYHSLQVSAEKRLSNNFSAGIHYTWSAYIDTASEVFNPSSGEVAIPQDSFNWRADRGRSSYDRPQRFSANFVYELPFFRQQKGLLNHVLGGWQANAFLTFQSGAPFTVLNGSDPTGALSGIDSLVGNAIRPNQVTSIDTSKMTIPELIAAGGASLYQTLPTGVRVGNVGRNTLRADGIGNADLGFIKNTRINERQNLQLRVEMYNSTNTRNFGIPEGRVNSSNFLNQWGTDGGNRRIILAMRYLF
jgi:Carboxypeptidase regulatory-like domain/TonB-dependent Receptor Plug Domain